MKFFHTSMFLWLCLVPAMAGLLILFSRIRRQAIKRFMASNLLDEMAVGYSRQLFRWKSMCLLLVVFFAIIALARPQWGFEWREVKRQGLDIILAVDVSKSMLTQDVKPNRLERVKLAARDLVKRLKGDRIGLLAFSGEAFMVCPLTSDYSGFMLTLDQLKPGIIPKGGTNVGLAIERSLESFEDIETQFKNIILVTDGESLQGDPLAAARRAKKESVRVYTVGIGTNEGELIQVESADGRRQFLKDEKGNFIKSRLNERLLNDIAVTTGGAYVRSSGAQFGLEYLYQKELSGLERRDIEADKEKKFKERYQWPLSVACIFLLVETFLSAGVRREARA